MFVTFPKINGEISKGSRKEILREVYKNQLGKKVAIILDDQIADKFSDSPIYLISGYPVMRVYEYSTESDLRSRKGGLHARRRMVVLSRIILGVFDPNIEVDHKNRNPLDNRIENLRICNRSQNMQNSRRKKRLPASGFRGVAIDPNDGAFVANIKTNYRRIHIGRFDNPIEAAYARDAAALRYHDPEFTALNFPCRRH